MIYLVTVKLPRNPRHNPRSKTAGNCPVTGLYCTDTTGEHHTVLIEAVDAVAAEVDARMLYGHVTRIEDAGLSRAQHPNLGAGLDAQLGDQAGAAPDGGVEPVG